MSIKFVWSYLFLSVGKLVFICAWYASVGFPPGMVKYCWFVQFLLLFLILSTQVLHLQRCSFRIKASEAHQARRAPLRCSFSIPARCPLRLPVPELTGSVTGPCRKGYDIVSNEISACSPLAPGHLLLLRRLFSSSGEAYYCIPLSKSHLGKKGEVQRQWEMDTGGSHLQPIPIMFDPWDRSARDWSEANQNYRAKGWKKESNCCVRTLFFFFRCIKSRDAQSIVYLYWSSVNIGVSFFSISWYYLLYYLRIIVRDHFSYFIFIKCFINIIIIIMLLLYNVAIPQLIYGI